jgi:hypothetical protein
MSKYVLAIIITLGVIHSHAQSFKKGYILNTQKDTLSGTVAFYDGTAAHQVCEFKPSENQAPITYKPGEIFGYGFSGDKVMESRTVSIDGVEKTQFLEVVVRGSVTLFKVDEHFWVEKQGVGFFPLENGTIRKESNDRAWVRNTNLHIATLNRMMYDCPKVKHEVETIELTKKALTRLVEKYNKCIGGNTIVYQESKPWSRVVFSLAAGVNFSKLGIHPKTARYEHLRGEAKETSVIAGPAMDIFFPRFSERFAFTTALYYVSAKYEIHNQLIASQVLHHDYYTAQLNQLKIPLGFKYLLGSKSWIPYVGAGLSLTANINSDLTWTEVNDEPKTVTTTERTVPTVQLLQKGYWVAAGLITPLSKKLNGVVELRYDHTNGLYATGSEMPSKIFNYQILLGIRWK